MKTTSIEYFNKMVCEFRELMGLKTFWADLNKVDTAKKALCHTYFNLNETPANTERAEITFRSTMVEFTKRAIMLNVPI